MLGPIVIEIAAFALFGALSFVFADRDQPLIRRDFLVDALYFLVSVLIYSQAIGQLFAHVHPPALLTAPSRAVSRWPLWAQAIVVLFAYDAMQYALHRWLHSEALWRFHAVHHTAREIDILTSFRIHPVDMAVYVGGPTVILLLAGFSPAAFAVLAPLNFLMSCLTHANLNWTYGPFRFVLASPMYHRWHHAIVEGSLSRNFAPNFPIWDLLLGTYYMPQGQRPAAYGAPETPDGFVGQMVFPFSKDRPASSAGVLSA